MKKRKALAIFMAIAMVFCYMPTTAMADVAADAADATAEAADQTDEAVESVFKDMPVKGFWSTTALKAAVSNGLLNGFTEKDGSYIKPDDALTRAQMATIVNRAFGAKEVSALSGVKDVAASEWYFKDMQKAVKMGTMKLDNLMRPNDSITRQEAFTILGRALKMGDGAKADLAKFNDASQVASWATESMGAMVKAGYIKGDKNLLTPNTTMTRVQFATIMDNVIKQYISTPGTVTQVAAGNVMVNVPGVTLQDVTITGDLIIGDGVGDGTVNLKNVVVKGNLIARGGGVESIIITGGSVNGKVIIAKIDGKIRVFAEGGAEIEVIEINDGKDDVILEGTVGTVEVTAAGTPVIIRNGTVNNLDVNTDGAGNVTVETSGKINNLVVGTISTGTKVDVAGTVTNFETSAQNTGLSGTGTVTNAKVNKGADNSKIATPGTKISNDGATGVTNDKGVEVSTGPVTPAADGGGGTSVVQVSAISVNKTETLLKPGTTETLTATVSPSNATNKTVTWSSSNEAVATVAAGEVTALTTGSAIITATAGGKTATITVVVSEKKVVNVTQKTGYDTIKAAVEAAITGDTLVLNEDISIESADFMHANVYAVMISGKRLTLDLNGKTLSANAEATVYIGSSGELIVKDSASGGKIINTDYLAIGNYGKLTMENGELNSTDGYALYNYYFNGTTYGTATISGGTLIGGDRGIANCGILEIAGGIITGEYYDIDNSGKLTFSGNMTLDKMLLKDGSDAAELEENGTMAIAVGVTISGESTDSTIEIEEGATINIAGTNNFTRLTGVEEFRWDASSSSWVAIPYVVGEWGQAGLVFYDKGSYSDGWRYLEAAPVSTEWVEKVWALGFHNEIIDTSSEIGAGLSNTTKIVQELGDGDYAAKLCLDLTHDGKDDWFLPSRFEAEAMYNNLHWHGLGEFSDSPNYWSSSSLLDEEKGDITQPEYLVWTWLPSDSEGNYINLKNSPSPVRAVRAF